MLIWNFLKRIYVSQIQKVYAYRVQERMSLNAGEDNIKVDLTELGHENGGGWN
jgi:hypothetical protein